MARIIIEGNSPEAHGFFEYAKTLPFARVEGTLPKKRSWEETSKGCIPLDKFWEEAMDGLEKFYADDRA